MEFDLHSWVKGLIAFDPQAIASNTTTNGNVIDTLDHESLEFFFVSKTITDGTYTLVFEESDTGAFGGEENTVSSELVLGAAVDFVAADDLAIRRAGLISKKRYVRVSVVSTGVTTGVDILSGIVVLSKPRYGPVADQST